MTRISPAHNNQVSYLGPKHGSDHSTTQSKISPQGKISCYANLLVNSIRISSKTKPQLPTLLACSTQVLVLVISIKDRDKID